MHQLPAELAAGLAAASVGQREAALGRATTALITRYQADRPATEAEPIVGSALLATAYLLYRMPATYAAVRAAVAEIPDELTAPASQLDLGGGTGAALWAASDRWPDLGAQRVLDNAPEALRAGRALVQNSSVPSLRQAQWISWAARSVQPDLQQPHPRQSVPQQHDPQQAGPEAADLVTVSYVLSELDEADQKALIDTAARAARQLVVVVEPGTRAGYRRMLAAREQLLAAGWSLVAPCPHEFGCPMTGDDWCHVAARVNRSAAHRRVKQAEKSYEDEKFSYLVVSRTPVGRAANRVLRHPRVGKGRVDLRLCTTPPGITGVVVTKRNAEDYRAARRTDWGDSWPPGPAAPR